MTTAVLNHTFIGNMRQLWRLDPRLAQRIDDLPPEASLAVEASKSGPPTARFAQADGRSHYLHSRHDPAREAADFCRGLDGGDSTAVVLSGFGLGHHVKAIHEIYGPDTLVIACEHDLVTLKTALEHVDLSRELESGRIEFLTQADPSFVHERLARHNTDLALGTIFAAPPASRVIAPEFHAAMRKAILDYVAFLKMSIVTLLHNSAITCRNIAANLPTYLATPPADILRGRFAGHPAILVAAGPSLGKNVDQLKGLEDRAIIIAAQTTLRLLLDRGIRPHFVTSLDFSDLSRQFFEGLAIPDDLMLVAEPKATWHVVDIFRGGVDARATHADAKAVGMAPENTKRRVILLDNDFAHRCVGEKLAKRTPMQAGTTVMHLSFYLSQWLGCDPIIFIGQDLGFSGHTYYTPGVAIHRAWQSELGRYSTLEMKEWERIGRHRPILRQATDVHGNSIYTDDQMFTYLQQFERDFARGQSKVIDATEGGVRKAGTTAMTLADAIGMHCDKRISTDRFDFDRSLWHQPGPLAAGRDAIAGRLTELATFRGICDETLRIIGQLEQLTERPTEFNRLISRVDELRTLVQEHDNIFRMVSSVSQRGELMRTSADRRMKNDAPKSREHTGRQLRRDRAFVEALLDGCTELKSILDQSLARFDAELERADVKTIGIIMVDLERSPLGTRSRLNDMLAGVPLLRRTLERAARSTRMERIFIVAQSPQGGAVADLAAGLPVTLETYSGQPPAYRELVTAGRMWGLDGWRGGVGGLCTFDEDMHVPAAAALAVRENADVVVSIPAAAAMIDPGLIDSLIEHYEKEGHIFRMTFAQAAPGLAPVVLARTLLEELAPSGQPPGAVLTYKPGKPIPDLTGREACYRGATEIIEAGGRLIGDTRRSFDRLERLIASAGPDADALSASRWLRDFDSTFVAKHPEEIEIELATADPWGGGSLLRPGSKQVPDRGAIDIEMVCKAVEGCAEWDDVRVVLGGFGEPLAHPNFGEIVRMIRAAGAAAIAVRTSGLIRNDEIDAALFETPVDVLEVMLDAATAEGYRRVHGMDSFDTAMNACGIWLQRRHEKRVVRPLIVPSMVKARETLPEMEAFFDGWTERHGTVLLTGYSHRAGQLADRAVCGMAPPQRVPCRRTFSRMVVLANGAVTTCDQDFAGRQIIGNVRQDSIRSIWQGKVLANIRCDDLSQTTLCKGCAEWHRP